MVTFTKPNCVYSVEISSAASEIMVKESQRSGSKETGGILIGNYREDGHLAFVVEATPCPSDSLYTPCSFQRGNAGLVNLLSKRWKEGLFYIGEWHYHPGGSTEPSGPDIRVMRDIAMNPAYSCREPILIIVGGYPPDAIDFSVTVIPLHNALIRLS
ncbi:Mov34/MPN/PAD-1 family protein [Pluralibacter gergoviae]|uniref:Mov34/MPN/PAD-1 family protein n=1 Tax=Pluralibacter gergoviae TaxID=61647 RepID=UPI002914805B|nr:Mov34/MPN/PAD-1 family protein [Pluralibacter gergoviae]MDU4003201.1 Mov34/MPN/PAD-1 family protein [Pluralibacter gergoviae]